MTSPSGCDLWEANLTPLNLTIMSAQKLFKNVLPPEFSRYMRLGNELKAYLAEIYNPKYGDGYNYQVRVSDPEEREMTASGWLRLQ